MNTLYIIGNGFDLAHGLKTSYSDFLLWYLKDCGQKKLYNTNFNDELIKLEGWGHFGDLHEIENIKDLIELFKYNNITFKQTGTFIRNIYLHEHDHNWVDIESWYFRVLLSCSKNDPNKEAKEIKVLNHQLNLLKLKLEEYLISLDKNIIHNKEIQSHFSQGNRRTNNKSLALNFNYTSTVENYLKKSLTSKIINIHGQLGDTENPIIFGYGDEMHHDYESIERLDIDEYLINFKSFGYLRNSNYSFFDSFINVGEFNVKILGHSCGLSDRVLLSTIFQHENCKKIEICYHKTSESENDHYEKTIKISRHFSTAMKAKMRSKIIPKNKSKPLCTPQ